MRKLLLTLLALLILLFVLGGLAAAPALQWYLSTHGPELVHRRMQVSEVSVNPLTGRIEAQQLVIFEPDDTTAFVRVPQLQTRLSLLRLLTGTICLDGLQLTQPEVSLWQRDTLLSCSDVIDHLMADGDGDPLPLVIRDIRLQQGDLRFRDLVVGSDLCIHDLSLVIPGIDFRELSASVGIDLSFVNGGKLQTQVHYDEPSQTYQLDLQLRDFNLQSMLPYVRRHMTLGDLSGQLHLDLTIKGHLDHLLNFRTSGHAALLGLEMLDPDQEPLLRCDSVSVGVRSLDLQRNSYRFSELYFHRPEVAITFARDSLDNFSRLLVASTDEATADAPADTVATTITLNDRQQPFRLSFDRFAIRGGMLAYRDESLLYEPFVYQLSEVDVTAPNFTLEGRNHFTAQARLGERGRITLRYDGWLENMRNMHLEAQAQQVAVADFSPYTVQMFGNEISSGLLSLESFAETKGGELYSQNHLCIVDPRVEKKRHGVTPEMNIPFRTGLYLLTDKDDVCDIDLPVHGNIDEPRFSYKRLLFRALGRFIVKVCTSPFRSHRSSDASASFSDDTRSLDDIDIDHVDAEWLKEE